MVCLDYTIVLIVINVYCVSGHTGQSLKTGLRDPLLLSSTSFSQNFSVCFSLYTLSSFEFTFSNLYRDPTST